MREMHHSRGVPYPSRATSAAGALPSPDSNLATYTCSSTKLCSPNSAHADSHVDADHEAFIASRSWRTKCVHSRCTSNPQRSQESFAYAYWYGLISGKSPKYVADEVKATCSHLHPHCSLSNEPCYPPNETSIPYNLSSVSTCLAFVYSHIAVASAGGSATPRRW